MRAITIESFESGPALADLAVPKPGPGEVLVRVRYSSINGFDVAVASGMVQGVMEHRFPIVLGKDFAGTVEATGEDVSTVDTGDDVFGVMARDYVGDGTFGEYAVIPEDIGLTRIPPGLDPSVAGALGLAGTAALGAIDAIAPAPGETVLIGGATGGVGSLSIQLVRARGADVIATAEPGEESEFVTDLGASHTVDHTRDLSEQVRAIRPSGVHAALHLAGEAEGLAALVEPGGRFASTLGVGSDQVANGLSVTTVVATPTSQVLDRLAAAVVSGELRVPIRQTYALADVPRALQDFSKGKLGKLAVTIED